VPSKYTAPPANAATELFSNVRLRRIVDPAFEPVKMRFPPDPPLKTAPAPAPSSVIALPLRLSEMLLQVPWSTVTVPPGGAALIAVWRLAQEVACAALLGVAAASVPASRALQSRLHRFDSGRRL
jgi:hypothetical protein